MIKETYSGLPYRIRVKGVFDPDLVHVVHYPIRMPLTPVDQEFVDKVWIEKYQDEKYKNYPKLSLSKVRVADGLLNLTLTDTDFKTCVGLVEKNSKVGGERFINWGMASGIESVIESADKRIIISQRSNKVNRAGWFNNVPSGYFELEHHSGDGVPNPKITFLSELKEEIGLLEEDLKKYYIGGVVQEIEGNSQVFFECNTNTYVNEIMDRNNDGEVLLFDIPKKPKVLIEIASKFASITTGTNLGSFYLYISQAFGSKWAKEYEMRLLESLNEYRQLPEDENEDYRKEKIEELRKLRE